MHLTRSRPYTCDALAERWDCSSETIRLMVKGGKLQGFRVGRMIRIPAVVVEEYEQCQTSVSESFAANSVSTGETPMASDGVISLRHAPERKRRPKA